MFIINNVKKRVVKRRYKSTRKLLVSTADLHSKRLKWLRRVPISLNVFLFEEFKKDKHLWGYLKLFELLGEKKRWNFSSDSKTELHKCEACLLVLFEWPRLNCRFSALEPSCEVFHSEVNNRYVTLISSEQLHARFYPDEREKNIPESVAFQFY